MTLTGEPSSGVAPDNGAVSDNERVEALVSQMTIEEKISQLTSFWQRAYSTGAADAPRQDEPATPTLAWSNAIRDGLGQYTRPFGSAPVDPIEGALALAEAQGEVMAANRWRIPAVVHEECLTGLSVWQATAYPTPLSWGAAFDPALVQRMAAQIGATMRAAGVHQGLAPLLDVTVDYRWGRTEETIGEDPYLVGTIGTAYVAGLEGAGIIATLKHFAGYPASRGGRNLAPVAIGQRDLTDVFLIPFEMALRDGGARSVMTSYSAIDGIPTTADPSLLTDLLRDTWDFTGTVVSDYFAVKFLQVQHKVVGSFDEAAEAALRAGVDVELPSEECFGPELVEAVRTGRVDEKLVDRALRRVLDQKFDLGLLEIDYNPLPEDVNSITFDDAVGQDLALTLARESIVLLTNPAGVLPLRSPTRVALVGPLADDPMAMLGCYTFPARARSIAPDHEPGIDVPTVRAAFEALYGSELMTYAVGCRSDGGHDDHDRSDFSDAVAAAQAADVCLVVVGDSAGHFGRGTSGEGCDVSDLRLPGTQEDLVSELIDTGTPVVLVVLSGRPYALGRVADRAAAIVQAFFPGQLGGQAVAEVLTGATNPSGRLPVSIPRNPGGQPGTYLAAPLARSHGMSVVDPTPLFGFGSGIGYTTFEWGNAAANADGDADDVNDYNDVPAWPVDGDATVTVEVRNTGDRPGSEVVQLYLHDPVAQVTRPEVRLIGYTRVDLDVGRSAVVTFTVSADLTAFTGREGRLLVEPGDMELRVARSSTDVHAALSLRLVGTERYVDHSRRLTSDVEVRTRPLSVDEEQPA